MPMIEVKLYEHRVTEESVPVMIEKLTDALAESSGAAKEHVPAEHDTDGCFAEIANVATLWPDYRINWRRHSWPWPTDLKARLDTVLGPGTVTRIAVRIRPSE